MGDPKKRRRQYNTPIHPWQKARIDEEVKLIHEYGLKNKKEIWKLASKARDFARQAKKLIADTTAQGELEKKQLLTRLASLNILTANSDLDDVLGLTTKNLMDRRLQTIVVKKGLAKSMKEARQLIVHGHIMIAKTNNRSVLGSMNDLVFQIQSMVDSNGGLDNTDLSEISRHLNRIPMSVIRYSVGIDELKRRLAEQVR